MGWESSSFKYGVPIFYYCMGGNHGSTAGEAAAAAAAIAFISNKICRSVIIIVAY